MLGRKWHLMRVSEGEWKHLLDQRSTAPHHLLAHRRFRNHVRVPLLVFVSGVMIVNSLKPGCKFLNGSTEYFFFILLPPLHPIPNYT